MGIFHKEISNPNVWLSDDKNTHHEIKTRTHVILEQLRLTGSGVLHTRAGWGGAPIEWVSTESANQRWAQQRERAALEGH